MVLNFNNYYIIWGLVTYQLTYHTLTIEFFRQFFLFCFNDDLIVTIDTSTTTTTIKVVLVVDGKRFIVRSSKCTEMECFQRIQFISS